MKFKVTMEDGTRLDWNSQVGHGPEETFWPEFLIVLGIAAVVLGAVFYAHRGEEPIPEPQEQRQPS